jgi:hypothetical protein
MLAPVDQNTGNNGYQETANPILAHPGLRALLQQQIAIRDGVAPAGTPAPAMMPSNSAAGPTAPPITLATQPTAQPQQATQPTANEARLAKLQNSKPGLENVYHKITSSDWGQNHPGLGKLAGIAGQIPATAADLAMSLKGLPVLGNSLSSIGQVMPGTTEQHNAQLEKAQGAVTANEANAEKEAQAQNLKSEVPLHAAQAGYYGAHAEAIGNHQVTPEEAAAMGNPDLAGSQMDPKAWEQLIKQHGINSTKVQTTGENNATKLSVAQLQQEARDAAAANKPAPHVITMQGGQPHVMERDPATKEYSIDRGIAPPNYAQMLPMMLQTKTTDLLDDQGQIHKEQFDPKTGSYTHDIGSSAGNITSNMRTMGQMAATVQPQMDNVKQEVQNLAQSLGPAVGRWNKLMVNKGGTDYPEFAGLDTDLDLLASAIVRTHFGARGGGQYREELKKQFGEAQSPDDLINRIDHAEGWIKGYAAAGGAKSAGGNQPAQGGAQGGIPNGATHTVPGSDGKMHYTDGKKDLGVVK